MLIDLMPGRAAISWVSTSFSFEEATIFMAFVIFRRLFVDLIFILTAQKTHRPCRGIHTLCYRRAGGLGAATDARC